jgi:hypothetical protein
MCWRSLHLMRTLLAGTAHPEQNEHLLDVPNLGASHMLPGADGVL